MGRERTRVCMLRGGLLLLQCVRVRVCVLRGGLLLLRWRVRVRVGEAGAAGGLLLLLLLLRVRVRVGEASAAGGPCGRGGRGHGRQTGWQ